MKTKQFPLRVVLSVTTNRLLSPIEDLYKILGWMTQDDPYTHQLPRFMRECRPLLLRWFPELAPIGSDISMGTLDLLLTDHPELAIDEWLGGLEAAKQEYDVPRIPDEDHERRHPVSELVSMFQPSEG